MDLDFLVRSRSPIKDWAFTIAGILLYALSLDLFMVGSNIAAGGLSGIAVVLVHFLPISVGLLVYLMNAPILIAAVATRGWRYAVGAVVGATLYSGAIELFAFLPPLTENPLVAAVYGGVFNGAGMALLTMGNGSTGGTDLLSRLLIRRFPAMSVGKMSAFVDGGVVLLSMIAFGDIEVGLYAIIAIFVCSAVADRIVVGFERGCICMVISSVDAQTLAQPLMRTLGRAVTRMAGTGMYTGVDRNVMLLAVRPQEVPKVKKLLEGVDPQAFVILIPANELIGGHFHTTLLSGHRP